MDSLPEELILKILHYLPITEIARLEHLNHRHGSIIQRNRNWFKKPHFRVIYSRRNTQLEITVALCDDWFYSEYERILRKVIIEDFGRILYVEGGNEYPEAKENETTTVFSVFQWIIENIRIIYKRWGYENEPDIPELMLNEELRIKTLLEKGDFSIGLLRLMKSSHLNLPNEHQIHRVLVENPSVTTAFNTISIAQIVHSCFVSSRISKAIQLLIGFKAEWRHMKANFASTWTIGIFLSVTFMEDPLYPKLLDKISEINDLDFQITLTIPQKPHEPSLIIRGEAVPGDRESPEPRRRHPFFRRRR